MRFYVIGINHHDTPIEIREKLAFRDTDIIDFTEKFQTENDEIMILSTCNRSEIYVYEEHIDEIALWNYIEEHFGVKIPESSRFFKQDDDALRHIFYVAIGLESMVVGEDQIQGQVISALETAQQLGGAKKFLNKIVRDAISFSKYVKTSSSVSDTPTSTAYLGIKLLEKNVYLKNKKAMIVGIGKMGKLASVYLEERGAELYISNRTYSNSIKFREENPDVKIIPYDEMRSFLPDVDILIVSTASPHTILHFRDFLNRDKEIYILDLSLPRGVEEKVTEISGVYLYDIDSLTTISKDNLNRKKEILLNFVSEIEDKVQELKRWEEASRFDDVFCSVKGYIDEVIDDTMAFIESKTTLSKHELRKVQKIVSFSINKVYREPLIYAKSMEPSLLKDDVIKFFEEFYDEDKNRNKS